MTAQAATAEIQDTPLHTTLHDWHVAQGAKMVPFAGYDMPVHYKEGIIAEHKHTRTSASIFDVSHMGQVLLHGLDAVRALERFVPADIQNLKPGQMRYTTLLNEWGGVVDDLIVIRPDTGSDFWAVLNASRKEIDTSVIRSAAGTGMVETLKRDLIAVQGPRAVNVVTHLTEAATRIGFMMATHAKIKGIPVFLMRSGYTGEDGFEISVEPQNTQALVEILLQDKAVKPAGLGARDTLRLEAGLCLYGHELNEKITPVEAGLTWVINKRRLSEGEFAGAAVLESELLNLPERVRVGLLVDDKAPARDGAEIQDLKGNKVGEITSGGFSPSLGQPIAMGYVDRDLSEPGTSLQILVRGRSLPCHVVSLPFVPHRYIHKGK
jgi:aminomethyltransferase